MNKAILPNTNPGFLPSIKVRQLVRVKKKNKSQSKQTFQQKLLFLKQDIDVPELIQYYYKGLQEKKSDVFQTFAVSINFKDTKKNSIEDRTFESKQKRQIKNQKKNIRVTSQKSYKFNKIKHHKSQVPQYLLQNNSLLSSLKYTPQTCQMKQYESIFNNYLNKSQYIQIQKDDNEKNINYNASDINQNMQDIKPCSRRKRQFSKFNFNKGLSNQISRFCTLDLSHKAIIRQKTSQSIKLKNKKQDKHIAPWVLEQLSYYQNTQSSLQLLQRSIQL